MTTYWSSRPFDIRFASEKWEVDFNKTVWCEGFEIHWKHKPFKYIVSVAEESEFGEKLPWKELVRVMENREYTTYFESEENFFRGRWFKIDITEFVDKRTTGPGAGSYVASLYEVVLNFDSNLGRMHPANQTYVIDHRPAYMVDGDVQTYWSAPLDSKSSVVLLEFEKLTKHI
jgi:hypothetical protein